MSFNINDLAELEKMAMAASPGPWEWFIHDASMASLANPETEDNPVLSVSPCKSCQQGITTWEFGRCFTPSEADAKYIAMASPPLLLGLINEIKQLRKKVSE